MVRVIWNIHFSNYKKIKKIICKVSSVYSLHHHHHHRHQCHHHHHLTKWLPGIYPVQSRPTLSLPITWIFPSPFTSLYLSPFPHFQTIPPQYSTLLSSFTISFFSLSESLSLSLNFRLPLHSAYNQAFSERKMCQAHLFLSQWGCVWVEILSVEVEAFSVYCACADIEVVSVFLLWLRLSWYCEARCWVWVCLCLIVLFEVHSRLILGLWV